VWNSDPATQKLLHGPSETFTNDDVWRKSISCNPHRQYTCSSFLARGRPLLLKHFCLYLRLTSLKFCIKILINAVAALQMVIHVGSLPMSEFLHTGMVFWDAMRRNIPRAMIAK
jgi:hypothetical protein